MERYDTRVEDGTLYIEGASGDVRIGSMDDICEILGGETYTIEYSEEAQVAGWLQTDEDGTITLDVRETIGDLDYDESFVERVRSEPFDQTTSEGYPVRTAEYANLMDEIWDSKGNVDLE